MPFVCLTLLTSCIGKFTLEKTPYTSNTLRLDGVYFTQGTDSMLYLYYFFYEDGTILSVYGRYDQDDERILDKYRQRLNDSTAIYYMENGYFTGGLFQIIEDKILIEKRYPGNGFQTCYIKEGTIINDTTFVLTSSYRILNGRKRFEDSMNETYYLMPFSPKPNRVNSKVF